MIGATAAEERASGRPGEIVHAGICIQTSPRVCVPINYTVRPMSRYIPIGDSSLCTWRVRACVRSARRVAARHGLYLSRATAIIIHASAPHAYTGRCRRPAARTYLIAGPRGGQRARSVSPLSGTDRCRPTTTSSYRRPISLTRTRARVLVSHTPLNIACTCDIGMARGIARGSTLNLHRCLLIEKSVAIL